MPTGEDEPERSASPLDRLAEYAAAPIDSTCLVLVAEKLDGRRKLAARREEAGVPGDVRAARRARAPRVDPRPLRARRGTRWTATSPSSSRRSRGPSCVRERRHRAPVALRRRGAPIDEDAVAECVARVRTADTWALVDAVGTRDLGAGAAHLADAYDPRDRGLPLLGALAWSIRQLARYQAAVGPRGRRRRGGAQRRSLPAVCGRASSPRRRAASGRRRSSAGSSSWPRPTSPSRAPAARPTPSSRTCSPACAARRRSELPPSRNAAIPGCIVTRAGPRRTARAKNAGLGHFDAMSFQP